MTESSGVEGVEHFFAIGGIFVSIVFGLLAWAGGSREGKQIAETEQKAATESATAAAVGAGLIDLRAYQAVIDGLSDVKAQLAAMDNKLARLVLLGENQDEREAREQQHRDIQTMLQEAIESLREDIRKGDERRAPPRARPA